MGLIAFRPDAVEPGPVGQARHGSSGRGLRSRGALPMVCPRISVAVPASMAGTVEAFG